MEKCEPEGEMVMLEGMDLDYKPWVRMEPGPREAYLIRSHLFELK